MSKFRLRRERLEVYNMWFEKSKLEGDALEDYRCTHTSAEEENISEKKRGKPGWVRDKLFRVPKEKHPDHFKGRIFICDHYRFHEIYNSKIKEGEGSFYTDLSAKNSSIRKRLDSDLLGTNEEEEVQEDHSDGLKNNSNRDKGDSVISGHDTTDLPLNPNEVQIHDSADLVKTPLPLMGPNAGFYFVGSFFVIVHRDSGDALIDDQYVPTAAPLYTRLSSIRCDDWVFWPPHWNKLNEPCSLVVEGEPHSLVLDCILFSDSKSVHVEVRWVGDGNDATDADTYICGELSVICDGRKSILFKTPPNKAKIVSPGKSIPLLKSVVAVPYCSGFEFKADLARPNNVSENSSLYFPTVNGSVDFPDAKINDDEVYTEFDKDGVYESYTVPGKLYKCKNCIDGIGGYIQVMCTIDIH